MCSAIANYVVIACTTNLMISLPAIIDITIVLFYRWQNIVLFK